MCHRTKTNSTRLSNNNRLLPDLKCYFVYLVSTYTTQSMCIYNTISVCATTLYCNTFKEEKTLSLSIEQAVLRHCAAVAKKGESLKNGQKVISFIITTDARMQQRSTIFVMQHLHKKQTTAHENMQLRNILYGGFFRVVCILYFIWYRTCSTACKYYAHSVYVCVLCSAHSLVLTNYHG